ncbi:MAG: hypothetical protein ACRDBG_15900, partial [Waterburya sp.]
MTSPYYGTEPTDLDRLGKLLAQAHSSNRLTNGLKGRYLGSLRGRIVSVRDPEERGQVLVETENTAGYTTQWIPVSWGVHGLQPESIVGSEVLLSPEFGDPQKLVVVSVLESGFSPIARLAIYKNGELPRCDSSNRGYQAVVITENNDYVVTCLNRNGSYLWIAPADLAHVHAQADRVVQIPDSDGSIEYPVENNDHVSLDLVSNTTNQQYS